MLKNFFTYKGRIGRKTYVISWILIWCASFLLSFIPLFLLSFILGSAGRIHGLDMGAEFTLYREVIVILALIFNMTLLSFPTIKRLHDIEVSGYFFLLLPVIVLLNLILKDANGQIRFESLMWMKYVISGLSWLSLAFLVLVFKKGTEGSNAYGSDPLPAQNPNV